MVSVKFHIGVSDLDSYFSGAVVVTESSKNKAVYSDPALFTSMTIEGSKLKFEAGDLVSGTVDNVTFKDAEGLRIATIKGEYKNFDKIDDHLGTGFFDHLLFTGNDKVVGSGSDDRIFSGGGKDKVFGRGGEDFLGGGRGDDRLTGGADSDTFYFSPKGPDYKGDGHDIITDFDAIGLDGEQDYLLCTEPLAIKKSGHDTILKFEGGDTITLLNVKPSDVTDADFASVL